MKGIYLILAELGEAKEIEVGKKFKYGFQKGFYGYVGSALGSLEKRVARHLNTEKKPHWHIDYMLNSAIVRSIICAETSQKMECMIAEALAQRLLPVLGFGCSDCHCQSHLFFCPGLETLKECVFSTFKRLNLRAFLAH